MKNVLVIYNGQSMFTSTVSEYVDAFQRYSRQNVHYLHVFADTVLAFDLSRYDAVLITYSCRLCFLDFYSQSMRDALIGFHGLKVAFVQDEYQETNKARASIDVLGIDLVFTCVPESKIDWVYPPSSFRKPVRFIRTLTGYVSDRLREAPRGLLPAISTRPNVLGYRGRNLWHRFGDLGFHKIEIGRQFKNACERRKIPHDIEWAEEKRIYHDKWHPFVMSCRATLATPSGSNIFDFDGAIERDYHASIKANPALTYEEYRPRIASRETDIDMGQVSPRIFEAAALGTALVLLEGSYSGVTTPGEDCIVVKNDYSNIEEVIDQVLDVALLTRIAERAFDNIIASDRWAYRGFIALVDDTIDSLIVERGGTAGAPLRAHDQLLLEELALASPRQAPLGHWLDLSHLRVKDDVYADLRDDILDAFSPPPTAATLAQTSLSMAQRTPPVAGAELTALQHFRMGARRAIAGLRRRFRNAIRAAIAPFVDVE